MPIDIIIFAVIAAVLVSKLKSVLGERHGDEKQGHNPFATTPEEKVITPAVVSSLSQAGKEKIIKEMKIPDTFIKSDAPEAAKSGLKQIITADDDFDLEEFLSGARYAFEMITSSFADGNRDDLKPLLNEDIYKSFDAVISEREKNEWVASYTLHNIKDARIADARLGGVMAYITVDFDLEYTSTVSGKTGKIIEGDKKKSTTVHDIWTFARDTRSDDPNWELVSTRIGDG